MVRIIDDGEIKEFNDTTFEEVHSGELDGTGKTLILDIHGIPVSGSQLKFNRKTGSAFRPKEHKQRVFTIYEYAKDYTVRHNLAIPVFKKGIPVFIEVEFYFPYRDGDYKRIKGAVSSELKDNAPKWVLGNKDLDNMLKPLKDGLKGVIYADDKQIAKYGNITKKYSESPKTIITVRELTDADTD